MDLGPALHLDLLTMDDKLHPFISCLILFVVLLIVLNLLFSEMDWGFHFSILGSLVLTLVVCGIRGIMVKLGWWVSYSDQQR